MAAAVIWLVIGVLAGLVVLGMLIDSVKDRNLRKRNRD